MMSSLDEPSHARSASSESATSSSSADQTPNVVAASPAFNDSRSESQSDEAVAFKSQFDEVCRLLESSKQSAKKPTHGLGARLPNVSPFGQLPRRRPSAPVGMHERTLSQPLVTSSIGQAAKQTIKKTRSFTSLNASYNAYGALGLRSTMSSMPTLSLDMLSSESDEITGRFDDLGTPVFSSSPFGSRPFTPLPLTPISCGTPSSRSPSTPFFNGLPMMDDEEFYQRKIRLEEERRAVLLHRKQLEDAISSHNLRMLNEPAYSVFDSASRLSSTPPATRDVFAPRISANSVKDKSSPPMQRKSSMPPRFMSQDPIGTPPGRRSGSSTPTTYSSSAPASSFSLFSRSPSLLPQQDTAPQKTDKAVDSNLGLYNPFSGSYCLTPTGSPPKIGDSCLGVQTTSRASTVDEVPHTTLARVPLYSTPLNELKEEELWNEEGAYLEGHSLSLPGDDEWDPIHDSMGMNRSRRDKGTPGTDPLARRTRQPLLLPRESNVLVGVGRRSPDTGLKSAYRRTEDIAGTNLDGKEFDRFLSRIPCGSAMNGVRNNDTQYYSSKNSGRLYEDYLLTDIINSSRCGLPEYGGNEQPTDMLPTAVVEDIMANATNPSACTIGSAGVLLQGVKDRMMNLSLADSPHFGTEHVSIVGDPAIGVGGSNERAVGLEVA